MSDNCTAAGKPFSLLRFDLLREMLAKHGPFVALIALVIITTIFNPRFLSPANIINILHNWSFVGLIAIGMTFVIILGGIDLSVGSLVALAGGLGIWVMNVVIESPRLLATAQQAREAGLEMPVGALRLALAGVSSAVGIGGSEAAGVLLAFLVILLAGLTAGIFNGLLITKGRIAPFIATLGGLAAFRSLAQALADGGEFRSVSGVLFQKLGTGGIPIVFLKNAYGRAILLPWPVLICAGVAVAAHILLSRTRFGRYVYAIGCNERAAVYSAINVTRIKLVTYTLIGLLTGLAALLNSSRMNAVSSGQTGLMWELDAIAAVVIGGTRMTGGSGRIWGTIVGLLMLGVISNMLNLLQISPYLQGLVKGSIIVAAVLLQRGKVSE